MAFVVVRVTGPEYLSEDSRRAFVRVEESVRQFSAHSRETIYLVRNPLDLAQDHFVVMWSRGAALVGMWRHGGRIRGGRQGNWTAEEQHEHTIAETNFENPYTILGRARRSLIGLVQKARVKEAALAEEGAGDVSDRSASQTLTASTPPNVYAIALFTQPIEELKVEEDLGERQFSAMSVESATSRTIFHLPNLLRITDQESVLYSNAELQAIGDLLERESMRHEATRVAELAKEHPVLRLRRAQPQRWSDQPWSTRARRLFHWWWLPVVVIPLLILYLILKPSGMNNTQVNPDDNTRTSGSGAPPAPMHRNSQLVLQLPTEVQLYVSPNVYRTRSDLDQALGHGEGRRFLPSTEQDLVMDSAELAIGVYGYFKVDSAWRKGKLLQTFKGNDTIKIDNFLPPLE